MNIEKLFCKAAVKAFAHCFDELRNTSNAKVGRPLEAAVNEHEEHACLKNFLATVYASCFELITADEETVLIEEKYKDNCFTSEKATLVSAGTPLKDELDDNDIAKEENLKFAEDHIGEEDEKSTSHESNYNTRKSPTRSSPLGTTVVAAAASITAIRTPLSVTRLVAFPVLVVHVTPSPASTVVLSASNCAVTSSGSLLSAYTKGNLDIVAVAVGVVGTA